MKTRAEKIVDGFKKKEEVKENLIDLGSVSTSPLTADNVELGMEVVFAEGDEYEGNVALIKDFHAGSGMVKVNMGSAHLDDIEMSRLVVLQ